MRPSREYRLAVFLLKLGVPVPLDIAATLLSQGIDVAALERRYAI
jgi:hypothetical protein